MTEIIFDPVAYLAKVEAAKQVSNNKLRGGHGVEIDPHTTPCNDSRVQGVERMASSVLVIDAQEFLCMALCGTDIGSTLAMHLCGAQ